MQGQLRSMTAVKRRAWAISPPSGTTKTWHLLLLGLCRKPATHSSLMMLRAFGMTLCSNPGQCGSLDVAVWCHLSQQNQRLAPDLENRPLPPHFLYSTMQAPLLYFRVVTRWFVTMNALFQALNVGTTITYKVLPQP